MKRVHLTIRMLWRRWLAGLHDREQDGVFLRRRLLRLLLCALLPALCLPTGRPAESGPATRPRRILYNLDGDSCLTLKADRVGPGPITVEDLRTIVSELTAPGSQVDTLLVCVNAQVMYYPTQVGTLRGTLSTPDERAQWSPHEQQRYQTIQAFAAAGIDPYAVILAARPAADLDQSPPTYEKSVARGCDPAAWAREKWVDFLTVSEFLFTAREWPEPIEPPFEVLTQIGDPKRLARLLDPTAAPAAPKTEPDVVIYDGTYPGWPWITQGPDGTLFCVFREGTEHDFSAAGRALLCRSHDRGRTWSGPVVIADAPGVDDRNVAVTVLPVAPVAAEVSPGKPASPDFLPSADSRRRLPGKAASGRPQAFPSPAATPLLVVFNTYTAARESLAMSVRSTDGGDTWAEPRPIGTPNTRTRSAPVVLADGALLLPFYVAPGNGSLAARSEDGGRTWTTVRVPDTEGFVGDEWDVLEISPGRVIGLIRNSHPQTDGFFWMTQSRDGGRTWSVPAKTNAQSRRAPSPPHLCRHNQTVTLIYADRRMVSVSAVSPWDDDFLNWDLTRRLPAYMYNLDESPIPDGSYPASVQTGPQERLIVDYEIRPESKRITGYFVTLPERW